MKNYFNAFFHVTMILVLKSTMEMPGIEPGTFHMQSERSTTELHPHIIIVY